MMPDSDFLQEKPEYIDILERIIDYEENHTQDWLEGYDCTWEYGDVSAHPTRLTQLEINGFIEKAYNSNNTTQYALTNKKEVKSILNSVADSFDDDGIVTKLHSFPSEDGLPDRLFSNIVGYDDVKWLLKRGITTDDITNFILIGEKGTGKSVFLTSMLKHFNDARYVVASEATSAGVLKTLFNELPKYFLVDEFDDMKKQHQAVFSSYAETGILSETKNNKNRQIRTNIKTIAAANNKNNIKDNIFDRFTPIEFEPYTEEEYKEVCLGVLPNEEGKSYEESKRIADAVWDYKGYGDVRAAIQVARLSHGDPEKVVKVLSN